MSTEKGRGRPALGDVDLSDMPAHITQPNPEEVERRRAFASTLETPAFLERSASAGVVKVVRPRAQAAPPEPVVTSATSITPTYGPAGCRPAGRRSEYGAGATTAGGGTQPYRQAALIRAASCPYEGGSRTNYGAAGDPPGAKKCRLRDRRLRYDG